MAFTYDVSTDRGLVRLLVADIDEATGVFNDAEIDAYLTLEGGNVKRAAAQAIDTNATNEALASKVLTDHQLKTDGASVAKAMREHANRLRAQADSDDDLSDDGAFFEIVPTNGPNCGPELTGIQYELPGWP